ncbi:MAG: hypothetical protein ACE147_00310 [Candidatus Methylomirabilales bacterium]
MLEAVKRLARRVLRAILSWASLLAVPVGIGLGLAGWKTLGALLIFGGGLCYFLVDPILIVLDLMPKDQERTVRRKT